MVGEIDDWVVETHVVEAEMHEVFLLAVVLRKEEVPVEDKGHHTEHQDEAPDGHKDIDLVFNDVVGHRLIAQLNAKAENDLEHGEENKHQEDFAENP